ncbi:MAG: STT3 domain-containing protein [Candidatus Pacearchaeota archaeon]
MESEKNNPEEIHINLSFFKSIFIKNNFTLWFSIFTFISLLITISSLLNISLGLNYINNIAQLFNSYTWIILTLMLASSTTLAYYEKYNLMFIPIMIWLLITTALVRTSNIDNLKNVATGDWTLGPDLDPFLYLRLAGDIVNGNLQNPDMMRGAPLGSDNYARTVMMPFALAYMYRLFSMFSDSVSLTYTAIIAPVIFFLISLICFFFFIYVLFSFKFSKIKSLIIATIASFLYAFVPDMLHRTVAGIPEIESLGMVWFCLAFLFFTLAWKQEYPPEGNFLSKLKNNKKIISYGLLSGLFSGAMLWTWGGYKYIYLVIVSASFLIFLFEKEKAKNFMIYLSWFFPVIILEILRANVSTGNITNVFFSITDSGLAIGMFSLIVVDLLLFKTKLKNKFNLEKIEFPKTIITIIITVLLGALLLLIINPSKLTNIFNLFIDRFFTPFGGGRVDLTVAENKRPYFLEALGNFGNLLWLFIFSLLVLFYESTKHFDSKKKIMFNFFFWIFAASFLFSRISPSHILNGENTISKIVYGGGLILFILFLFYSYIRAYINKEEKTLEDFKKIEFLYFFLIIFAFFGIMFMTSAIRFFFLTSLPLVILTAYLPIKIFDYFKDSRDQISKMFLFLIFIGVIVLILSLFIMDVSATSQMAKSTIPGPYYQQWQYAMNWVQQNTPENSIFAHWWDYGYWVQTLGKRATIADGGHPAGFDRNHFIGRYLLTTSNPKTALTFMNSLNVTHLLIDSTDIGKYSAFSSIGSDKSGKDRLSWIPVMPLNPNQIVEKNDSVIVLFSGGQVIDNDIIYKENETELFLPAERAGLAAVLLEYQIIDNEISFSQPMGIFIYNNQRYNLPIKYIYFDGKLFEFKTGVNSIVRIIPALVQTQEGINLQKVGAIIYLSEKTKDTLFSQLYLLDDVKNLYPTLKLVHVEDNLLVKELKKQGAIMDDFVYYGDLVGPIKIWEVNYPEGTPKYKEYLEYLGIIQPLNKWGELDYLGV